MDEIFDQYHIPLLNDFDNSALIEAWKQNIDADAYGKDLNHNVKLPPNKKKVIVVIALITGQQA